MQRGSSESFEEYQIRRREEKAETKRKLKGTVVWERGTYIKRLAEKVEEIKQKMAASTDGIHI